MYSKTLIVFNLLLTLFLLFSCNNKSGTQEDSAQVDTSSFWTSLLKQDSLIWEKDDVLDQEMANYIYSLENLDSLEIVKSINGAAFSLENSDNLYKFWDKIDHYAYHPNSPLRNDEFSLILFQELVKIPHIKESYKVRYNLIINNLKKNRSGYLANDFIINDDLGNKISLYDINSPLLVVIFYDPSCHTCQDIIRQLGGSQILSNLIQQKKVNVLSVNVMPSDSMSTLVKEIPNEWIKGTDHSQSVINKELYNILAYPTIYILDQDKKVILKDADLKQTILFLNSIS